MSDFVNFGLAQKLKDKGFDCKYPFAMYDEDGDFYPLFTSCDEDEDSNCIFGKRMYYGYDDFIGDKDAVIAPKISQVLKWLKDKFSLHISQKPYACKDGLMWMYEIRKFNKRIVFVIANKTGFIKEEEASLAGIEYVLDNLI